ncbi:site-specific integrase [Mesorhizobium sp. M7A.F.Ca.MR.176.00.0.0]|uniref:tyrosine-type recombinase/integrase n=1 Tax=Mesorhizobium sp. M7A.F.Ca.MR.176.00.0.0 TaxID=2496776 RepID=UPI000FD2008D|nr:site-specific integrase [Mesorhizobium sp. M7A.F.Ca.MR.176.00.0.0]RUU87743.1 site-specific integrase [Mesorhizobium sp. M7A.F.Ca.MR.176.00.0.0]
MRGNITRRGKASWRLKFDNGTDPVTGKRLTEFVTVRGTKKEAEAELSKRLNQIDGGNYVANSKETVAVYVRGWLDGNADLAPTTKERFGKLVENQIVPHLGSLILQQLRPAHVSGWHNTLRKEGGKDGGPLSPATVRQAHRVLHLALARAFEDEKISRNVASGRKLPKADHVEIQILQQGQIAPLLEALQGHWLSPVATVAVGTGMRQGEIMGLQWADIDLDKGSLRVERSLEETKATGLRFKAPKSKSGIRTISLPASVIDALKVHRKRQLEQRIALGLGKPGKDALVFCGPEGEAIAPSKVSGQWRDAIDRLRSKPEATCPKVRFHDLRHTHASALIASGLDVVAISRRLGHASPVVTLSVYAHLFKRSDEGAAAAIEAAMRTGAEQ